jgi:hypothetical protein
MAAAAASSGAPAAGACAENVHVLARVRPATVGESAWEMTSNALTFIDGKGKTSTTYGVGASWQ